MYDSDAAVPAVTLTLSPVVADVITEAGIVKTSEDTLIVVALVPVTTVFLVTAVGVLVVHAVISSAATVEPVVSTAIVPAGVYVTVPEEAGLTGAVLLVVPLVETETLPAGVYE